MSSEWHEKVYVSHDGVLGLIDEYHQEIELKLEEAKDAESESWKVLLLGQREVLRRLSNDLSEWGVNLGHIAQVFGLVPRSEE